MSAEKTEQASEQRKKKAREQGDIVHSRELMAACAMLGGLLLLGAAVRQFAAAWRTAFAGSMLASLQTFNSPQQLVDVCGRLMLPLFAPLGLVMAAALVGALGSGLLQSGGVQFRPGALAWKPGRLNPLNNAKQIFSARSAMRFAKALLPAAAVTFLGVRLLRQSLEAMPAMSCARVSSVMEGGYTLAIDAAWVAVAWSALDYAVEWRSWSQRLRMSKQELRDEAKEANGNPHTKGRIRQIQRTMRKRRVKADVSRATVIITNPTHYAVALLFSYETMGAPTVLCKGRDLHALDIREEARWAGVPIVENPPLARSLYRTVEEGHAIPFDLYAAVAAILAYLYRQQTQRDAQRQQQNGGHGMNSYPAALPAITTAPTIEGQQ